MNDNKRTRRLTALALLLAQCPPLPARAGGLATNFGNVWVNNVPMGSTVSLRDLTGIAYRVTNTALNAEEVLVSVVKPEPSEPIAEGYEIIPDPSWVKLAQDKFYLAPGQEGVADVLLNIPKDDRYLNKKFQVWIWARNAATGRLLAVGLKSRLLIQVSATAASAEERKKSAELIADLDFHLNPPLLQLDGVPPGEKVSSKGRFNKAFKLINLSDKAMTLKLGAQAREYTSFKLPAGAAEGRLEWLAPEKERMRVEPNSVAVIPFTVQIPKGKEHAGKAYHFVLKAELEGYPVPVSAFGQVIVNTHAEEK